MIARPLRSHVSWSPRRRRVALLLLLALGTLLLAWFFAKLASEMLEGEMLTMDVGVQRWMSQHRLPWLLAAFRVVTFLGAKEVLTPIALLVAWLLLRGTGARAALALLAFSAIAAGEFVALLKRSFHVMRPAGGIAAGLGYSFPSGHSTGISAVCVTFAYLSLRRKVHPRVITPLCVVVALLVGISRVYLDVHWASDVLGGWLVGAAFGAGTCAIYELIQRGEQGPAPGG